MIIWSLISWIHRLNLKRIRSSIPSCAVGCDGVVVLGDGDPVSPDVVLVIAVKDIDDL